VDRGMDLSGEASRGPTRKVLARRALRRPNLGATAWPPPVHYLAAAFRTTTSGSPKSTKSEISTMNS
jgi:hypothetical protein